MLTECPACKGLVRLGEKEHHLEHECPERSLSCRHCRAPCCWADMKVRAFWLVLAGTLVLAWPGLGGHHDTELHVVPLGPVWHFPLLSPGLGPCHAAVWVEGSLWGSGPGMKSKPSHFCFFEEQ